MSKKKKRRPDHVMISVVSKRYSIHPQTLRMYEREGLLSPERSGGNTRLYGPDQMQDLEMILRLTRELGVNLAGVEVIMHLCRQLREEASIDAEKILDFIRRRILDRRCDINRTAALVLRTRSDLQKVDDEAYDPTEDGTPEG